MRDFAKDREICNAATPGPWRWSRNRWQLQNPETEAEILFAESAAMLKKHWDVSDPGIQEWRPSKSDAKFIAKARTGWPAALDRIAELEAENARLTEQLERWNAAKSSMNTTLSLPPTTGANSS